MYFKTRIQLADELGISRRTLKRWMDQEGINRPRQLIPLEEADRILSIMKKRQSVDGLEKGLALKRND